MSVKRYSLNLSANRNVELNESLHGSLVKYHDYAALEARCAALAAENAGLKTAVTQQIELRAEIKKAGRPPHADFWVQSICEAEEKVKRALEETPNTDAFLAEVRAQGVGTLSNAAQSVIAERQRQQSAEGWTPEHDDQYGESQLLWASSCYVLNTIHSFNRIPLDWPWAPEWWKPTNPRRDLVKAGALILAEIERIDRAAAGKGE